MTQPSPRSLPRGEPPYLIAETPPQFPCWLWVPSEKDWFKADREYYGYFATHWSPDSPDAPEPPTQTPKPFYFAHFVSAEGDVPSARWTVQHGPGFIAEFPDYKKDNHATAEKWARKVADLLMADAATPPPTPPPPSDMGVTPREAKLLRELEWMASTLSVFSANVPPDAEIDRRYIAGRLSSCYELGTRKHECRPYEDNHMVEALRQQLTAMTAERDHWKGVAEHRLNTWHGEAEILTQQRNELERQLVDEKAKRQQLLDITAGYMPPDAVATLTAERDRLQQELGEARGNPPRVKD